MLAYLLLVGRLDGSEVHENGDQFIRVESGQGAFVLDGKRKRKRVSDGFATVIHPEKTEHNVVNTSVDVFVEPLAQGGDVSAAFPGLSLFPVVIDVRSSGARRKRRHVYALVESFGQ